MPTNIPVMPILALILLLLPIRFSNVQMKGLAFLLWVTGGIVLTWRGANFLFSGAEAQSQLMMTLVILAAIVIGYGKGKFVLAKTSQKNIDRIDGFTESKRPIQVYSMRSWIIISLMVMISVSLNIFEVAGFIRGAVNLGIGTALIISSLTYVKSLMSAKAPAISR